MDKVLTGVKYAAIMVGVLVFIWLVVGRVQDRDRAQQVSGLSTNLDATRRQVELLCAGRPDCKPVAPPAGAVRATPQVQPSPIPAPSPGQPGRNGTNGTNATDAQIQRAVASYLAAHPAPSGLPGKDGTSPPCLQTDLHCQGKDGADGQNGHDGKDGKDGAAGPSCPDGYSLQPETVNGNQALVCEAAASPSPSPSISPLTARRTASIPRPKTPPSAPAAESSPSTVLSTPLKGAGGGLPLQPPFGLGLILIYGWPKRLRKICGHV